MDEVDKDIKVIVDKWLQESQNLIVRNYIGKKIKASGKFEREIRNESIIRGTGIRGTIYGPNHSYWIENGRRKNNNQLDKSVKAWVGWAGSTFIKQWIKDKGLNLNPFAVAASIARKGTKAGPRNLVEGVMTQERIDELMSQLTDVYIKEIKSDVIKLKDA